MIRGAPVCLTIRPVLAAAEDTLLRSAAVAGFGLTIVPRSFVRDELARGSLESLLETNLWRPERSVHALPIQGRLAPIDVRRFITDLGRSTALPPGR